jgi:hypothetical protein
MSGGTTGLQEDAAMMYAVVAAVACAVLGVVYFAIRFWLVSTRPADIRDIPTPTLDRLNREALERMGAETVEEDEEETEALEEEEAPEGLRTVVPQEEGERRET